LKEKIKRLQKDVAQKEAKQRRDQLLLFYLVALDGYVKCDFDVVKVDFEIALNSYIIFVERIEELRQQVQYEEELGCRPKGSCKQQKLHVLCVMLKLLNARKCMPIV
jgi:hypothetical protein